MTKAWPPGPSTRATSSMVAQTNGMCSNTDPAISTSTDREGMGNV